MAKTTTINTRKAFFWVKDGNGNTWLCPKDSVKDPRHLSEEEIKECVDESYNPGEGW